MWPPSYTGKSMPTVQCTPVVIIIFKLMFVTTAHPHTVQTGATVWISPPSRLRLHNSCCECCQGPLSPIFKLHVCLSSNNLNCWNCLKLDPNDTWGDNIWVHQWDQHKNYVGYLNRKKTLFWKARQKGKLTNKKSFCWNHKRNGNKRRPPES